MRVFMARISLLWIMMAVFLFNPSFNLKRDAEISEPPLNSSIPENKRKNTEQNNPAVHLNKPSGTEPGEEAIGMRLSCSA